MLFERYVCYQKTNVQKLQKKMKSKRFSDLISIFSSKFFGNRKRQFFNLNLISCNDAAVDDDDNDVGIED